MKLLRTINDRINGGACRYYVCDSVEEYNALVERYTERKGRFSWESIHINTEIICEPTTIFSDGVATSGGMKIKGIGVTCGYIVGLRGWNGDYYINPETLETEETKVENWYI